jgi:hypothetical protein
MKNKLKGVTDITEAEAEGLDEATTSIPGGGEPGDKMSYWKL